MNIINKRGLLDLIAACFLIMFFATNALSLTSEISPSRISVTSLYHGSKLVVTGETRPDEEIIIKFSSPESKFDLRKKGKAGGVFWMNIGELEFNHVSDVYLVYATNKIGSILSEKQQEKYSLGYDAFKRLVEVSPVSDESDKVKWVGEFVKFKEKNGIYGIFTDRIETEIKDNKKIYKLKMDWPYQAPPLEYTVSVYSVKDGVVQDYNETSLVVETVGALKFISNMAFNNSSVYGIASLLIAIAAGFIVSVIFKGGGSH
ncbi:MAG TPA: hypothetical protein ENG83_05775 [Nitrospirae bacterium]|nr:putative transmembrane protein [bacterium BMS3Abin06]HDH11692.1 hypothetical protein [Nitrospirota bacterium]